MKRSVCIDFAPESATRYGEGWTIVAIDVIRATTMAITAASMGRRCYPVDSTKEAFRLARVLPNALLAGEIGGEKPPGFHMNNSPSELASRQDVYRPLVMLSSSGTKLVVNSRHADFVYLACFRNSTSTGRRILREGHRQVAVIGAGSLGQFREEDQICCAWIASDLVVAGYSPLDESTTKILETWSSANASDCLISNSINYLARTGQIADLDFILERIDDLDDSYLVVDGRVERVRYDAPLLTGQLAACSF